MSWFTRKVRILPRRDPIIKLYNSGGHLGVMLDARDVSLAQFWENGEDIGVFMLMNGGNDHFLTAPKSFAAGKQRDWSYRLIREIAMIRDVWRSDV